MKDDKFSLTSSLTTSLLPLYLSLYLPQAGLAVGQEGREVRGEERQ